jgi:ribosomal protein L21E
MSKRRIPFKDIKKIRENYKADKANSLLEEDKVLPSRKEEITLAKEAGKMSKINETGMTPREIKKAARKKIKNLKKDFSSKRKASALWSFDVGDTVSFNYKNNVEMGMIVSLYVPEDLPTIERAKKSGYVVLLSSAGRVRIKPIEVIEKI